MKKILFYLLVSLSLISLTACSFMVQDFKKASEAKFTLIKNFEATDTADYDLNLTEYELRSGNPLAYSESVYGFDVESKTFDKQSNTLTINYKRKIVTLSFYMCGGIYNNQEGTVFYKKGKYGERFYPIDNETIKRIDFIFLGWSNTEDGESVNLPYTYPAEDASYYALWTVEDPHNDYTHFTVKTYLQNIVDDDYTELYSNIHKGRVGEQTNVLATDKIEYFEAQPIEQKTIARDGSTVVEIKYNREIIKFEFFLSADKNEEKYCHWEVIDSDPNDSNTDPYENEEKSITISGKYYSDAVGKYTEKINQNSIFKDVDGENWDFVGWNEVNGQVDDKFRKNRTYYAVWKKTVAIYKVEHWFEDVNNSDEYVQLTKYPEVQEKNTVGEYTNAQPYKETPGFAVDHIEDCLVEDEGTVAKVYYRRNYVTVIIDPNGGKWPDETSEPKYFVGKSGKEFPEIDVSSDLSSWVSWTKNENSTVDILPNEFPASNETYVANWEKVKSIYAVKYYVQNINDDEYVQNKAKTETHIGKIGDYTTVADSINEKQVKGFTITPVVQDIQIPETDDAEISVKYQRNTVTITIDLNGGEWHDTQTTEPRQFTGKYEQPIVREQGSWYLHSPDYWQVSEDNGVTWKNTAKPTEFPAENLMYKVIWKNDGVEYKVEYYKQNLKADGYDLEESVFLDGKVDETTTASAKLYPGFKLKDAEIHQQIIKADGSTVVKIYYDRNSITYRFDSGEHGKWDDNSDILEVHGLYGQTVQIPSSSKLIPAQDFYQFDGWTRASDLTQTVSIPSTYGEYNMDFTAHWKKLETTDVNGHLVNTTKKDLEVQYQLNNGIYTFYVSDNNDTDDDTGTIPFGVVSNWIFNWYVDGQLVSEHGPSIDCDLETGNHQIYLVAKYKYLLDIPYTDEIAVNVQ